MILPYSFLPIKILKKSSRIFLGIAEDIKPFFFNLELNLKQAQIDVEAREHVAMVIFSSLSMFFFSFFVLAALLLGFRIDYWLSMALILAFCIFCFVFFQEIIYPRVKASRRIRDLERNLLSALRTFLIQLNSGVPLFDTIVVVSSGNYGELSKEFKKAIKEINAGRPQVEVLEELATDNPSLFFRRALWQIVNGMKAGANINMVIKEVINALSQEQIVQIQKYGAQLNPLAMFYMIMVVILPSLGMTFLLMISSFFTTSEFLTKTIFWGLYGLVFFFQIMFLGIIKTKRPNLLGA